MAKDAKHMVSETAERVQAIQGAAGGDMTPEKLTQIVQNSDAILNNVTANGSKMLDGDALLNVAKAHASPQMQNIVTQMQGMQQDGVSLGAIAQLAGSGDLPMNDKAKEFFKMYGESLSGKGDANQIGQVPGLVVNKETGNVSFFGLDFLEVPPQIAHGLAVGYTLGLNLVNSYVYKKGYSAGRAVGDLAGSHMKLTALDKHRFGQIAAIGAIFGTTHWPDINIFIQNEKKYRKSAAKLANKMAPVLDDLKGGHGLASLYSVKQEENELIYNERRRMGALNNAERFRNGVQAVGRSFAFIASAIEGKTNIRGLENQAKLAAESEHLAAMGEDAFLKQVAEIAEYAERIQRADPKLTDDAARELAKGKLGIQTSVNNKKGGEEVGKDKYSQFMHYGAAITTLVAQGVGQSLFGKRTAHLQPVSAYDMIMVLKKQLDDDPKQKTFSLPDGMQVEGIKGSSAKELPLTLYIMQIFQQHEKDCSGEGRIPSRLNERLHEASSKIAKALSDGELDGLALIKLVGERKVVRSNGKTIAGEDAVQHELDRLKAHMRHVEWVDEREYFADASFSKEQLKEAWKALSDEEKDMFAGMVPPQILESAGISAKEVKQRRAAREQMFEEDLTRLVQGIQELGEDKLKQLNMTKSEIDLVNKAAKITKERGAEAITEVLPSAGKHIDITHPLTELIVHHLQYGGKLQDIVERGIEA